MKFRLPDFDSGKIKKGIEHIRTTTLPEAFSKARSMVTGTDLAYDRFFRDWLEADEETLALQRTHVFPYAPLVSVIVPVYMTPELSLRAMIESVQHQTYENWELCLVDGSLVKGDLPVLDARRMNDEEPTVLEKVYSLETERIIRQYMEGDSRIHYRKMEENQGISGNTNQALSMAHGVYAAFLDHDDVLTENALYEVVASLQDTQYDLLYSDEDRMSENGSHYMEPRFKPDFDIDLLRSYNYIAHLLVVRRSLLLEVGGFRGQYDGAQDYDMLFLCAEKKIEICHIANVLYHKRIHEGGSTEREIKHARENQAGKEALEAHVEREHLLATVECAAKRSVYRVRYDTPGNPLVSIIVHGHTDRTCMARLLEPFYEKSRYSNFEIIVVDIDHTDAELQRYYQQMQSRRKNLIVIAAPEGKSVAEYCNIGSTGAHGAYLFFLDAALELRTPAAIGEMLGICMRGDVGIVTGVVYDDADEIYYAGLEFAGKYENNVQTWQRETERQVKLEPENNLYRYPYRGIRNPDASVKLWDVYLDETGARRYFGMNREFEIALPVCMLVKKGVFAQTGGFSERFWSNCAILDFCLRVREHGFLIVSAAQALWNFPALPDTVRQIREQETLDAQKLQAEQDLFEILWPQISSLR